MSKCSLVPQEFKIVVYSYEYVSATPRSVLVPARAPPHFLNTIATRLRILTVIRIYDFHLDSARTLILSEWHILTGFVVEFRNPKQAHLVSGIGAVRCILVVNSRIPKKTESIFRSIGARYLHFCVVLCNSQWI